MDKIKRWYKSEANAERDAARYDCDIVTDANGWTDIYYLVPRSSTPGIQRVIQRNQSECGFGKCRVIGKRNDGSLYVVSESSNYRVMIARRGAIPDDLVESYLRGYYTRREETSKEIHRRKEAARISHALCDTPGKVGHDMRREIRRRILSAPLDTPAILEVRKER